MGEIMNNLTTVKNNNLIDTALRYDEDMIYSFLSFIDAKPKTTESYTKNLKAFFKYIQDNNITNPKRNDILAYRNSLKVKGLKNTTIQAYITAVRLFFRWTNSEGIYPNIADNVKGAKVSRMNKKDYLTSNQAKAVLSNIDKTTKTGARDYAIISLMLTTGLRTIEVSRANIEDLRPLGEHTVLYIQGKGKEDKGDYVKIPTAVEVILRDYIKSLYNKGDKAPLFQSTSNNNKGGRLTTKSISDVCKKAMRNTGLDSNRLTAHSLRHTAVTLSILNGNTLQEAQLFARHSNITTTQVYAHNLDKLNNKCSDSIANNLF